MRGTMRNSSYNSTNHFFTSPTTLAEFTNQNSRSDDVVSEKIQSRFRVLIADDNISRLEHLHELLSPLWHVECVTNGEEALNRICISPPELFLTKSKLPIIDGITILSRLRSNLNINTFPTIIYADHMYKEEETAALKAGADDFIAAP